MGSFFYIVLEWTPEELGSSLRIHDLELYISNVGLATFGGLLGRAFFYEWTDNKVALGLMRSLNPSTDSECYILAC